MDLNNLDPAALEGEGAPEGRGGGKLGRTLVRRGWISDRDLERALARQRDRGGRLGTCLLEIGALSEELLLVALSELLGVPKADVSDLSLVPERVHRLLPAEVAVRRRAVPFRATRQRVDMALADLGDLSVQDELSFILGKSLTVHVATESRIYEALERYYGYECPIRYRRLLGTLNRRGSGPEKVRRPEPAAAPRSPRRVGSPRLETPPSEPARRVASPRPETPPAEPARRVASPRLEPEPSEPARHVPPRPSPGRPPQRPPTQAPTLEETLARLDRCTEVDEVGAALLDHLSGGFLRVVLLKSTPRLVRGWMGRGPGLDPDRLLAYNVSVGLPSVFTDLELTGDSFVGTLPETPSHRLLIRCWGEEAFHPCAVLPIRIRSRPVAYIYLDRDCLGVDGIDLNSILLLARATGTALGNCILARKAKGRGHSSEASR